MRIASVKSAIARSSTPGKPRHGPGRPRRERASGRVGSPRRSRRSPRQHPPTRRGRSRAGSTPPHRAGQVAWPGRGLRPAGHRPRRGTPGPDRRGPIPAPSSPAPYASRRPPRVAIVPNAALSPDPVQGSIRIRGSMKPMRKAPFPIGSHVSSPAVTPSPSDPAVHRSSLNGDLPHGWLTITHGMESPRSLGVPESRKGDVVRPRTPPRQSSVIVDSTGGTRSSSRPSPPTAPWTTTGSHPRRSGVGSAGWTTRPSAGTTPSKRRGPAPGCGSWFVLRGQVRAPAS